MAGTPHEGEEALEHVQSRLQPDDKRQVAQLATDAGVSIAKFLRRLVEKALDAGLGVETAREFKQQ